MARYKVFGSIKVSDPCTWIVEADSPEEAMDKVQDDFLAEAGDGVISYHQDYDLGDIDVELSGADIWLGDPEDDEEEDDEEDDPLGVFLAEENDPDSYPALQEDLDEEDRKFPFGLGEVNN